LEEEIRYPHTREKIKTSWGHIYWKACGCGTTEEATECKYCNQVFRCRKCGWKGNYPPHWDGGPFGGLHVCPKCNWTFMGMLHVWEPWEVLEYPDDYDEVIDDEDDE
jgi:hypothetical protein